MSPRATKKDPLAKAKAEARRLRDGTFVALMRQYGIPEPEREFRFHPTRKWAFDFAFPAQHIAIEVNGGAHTGGRHVRGQGFVNDMEKLSAAASLGWRVLQITPAQMDDLATVKLVARTLGFICL